MKSFFSIFFAIYFVLFSALPAYALKSNDPEIEQWGYEDTGVYRAWDYTTGSSDVVVAIIDNGFDSGHPDIRDNVWKNEDEIAGNGVDDDNNGYIDDVVGWNFALEDRNQNGDYDEEDLRGDNNPRPNVNDLSEQEKSAHVFSHGTVVAGIIGAVGNNGRDGAGINWNVKLMNVKVLGNGGVGFLDKLPDAVRYAVDNGAHVINISIVGGTRFSDLDDALEYAYNKGVFVVVASGNDAVNLNTTRMYPVCSDADASVGFVIGASAINEDHHSAFFSNIGSDCIDIAAPGTGINSTVRFSPTNGLTDTYMYGWEGTSFAAPFIAGAAALVKSVRPQWDAKEITEAILTTVQHTPNQDEDVYADLFGAGLLQIDKALEYALNTAFDPKQPPVNNPVTDPNQPTTTPVDTSNIKHLIISYDPRTGEVEERNALTDASSRYKRLGLVNVDKMVSFKDRDGLAYFAVADTNSEGKKEVTVYTQKFRIHKKIVLSETGPVDIMVGDVDAADGLEIVVAPRYKSDTLFGVYRMDGTKLYNVQAPEVHNGVQLALSRTAGGLSEVLALYDISGQALVARYSRDVLVLKLTMDSYAKGGTIAAGDIDADGVDEFIIGSGIGQPTALAYFEPDGRLKSKFFGYDPGFSGGIRAQIMDYDADGAQDVLISALNGSQPARVWNRRVKRLANWYPFGEQFSGSFLTIPSF